MARVVKVFRTLRNHWKKSTFAVCVLSYGGYWLYGKHWWVSHISRYGLDRVLRLLFPCPKCCLIFYQWQYPAQRSVSISQGKVALNCPYRLLKNTSFLYVTAQLKITFSVTGIWTAANSTTGAAEESNCDFEPCSLQWVRLINSTLHVDTDSLV